MRQSLKEKRSAKHSLVHTVHNLTIITVLYNDGNTQHKIQIFHVWSTWVEGSPEPGSSGSNPLLVLYECWIPWWARKEVLFHTVQTNWQVKKYANNFRKMCAIRIMSFFINFFRLFLSQWSKKTFSIFF